MTDLEVNKEIAELILSMRALSMRAEASKDSEDFIKFIIKPSCERDYCNNWNDLMPLCIEHGVDLWRLKSSVWVSAQSNKHNNKHFRNENPQRALAECLLKVLQEKSDEQ